MGKAREKTAIGITYQTVELAFYAPDIAPEVFERNFLALEDQQSSEVIRGNDGQLRQILTDTCLADINDIDSITDPNINPAGTQNGFVVRLYQLGDTVLTKANGLYNLPASPCQLSIVKQEAGTEAEPTKLSHLSHYDIGSGVIPKFYTFERTVGSGDNVTHVFNFHHGSDESADAWEEVTTVMAPVPAGLAGNYTVLLTRKQRGADGALHLVEKSKKRMGIYKKGYPVELCKMEGPDLTEASTEDGSDWIKKTTSSFVTNSKLGWSFNEPTEVTVIRRSAAGAPASSPHITSYSYLEKLSLGWRQTTRTEPYLNVPGAKVTLNQTALHGTTTSLSEERIDGVLTRRVETTRLSKDGGTQVIENRKVYTNDSSVLSTVTKRHQNESVVPEHLRGRPISTLHPNGTLETWSYTPLSGNLLEMTHDSGSANSANDTVVSGTRIVTTRNLKNFYDIIVQSFALEAGVAYELETRTATEFDALGRPKKWDYNIASPDTDYSEVVRDCCSISRERSRDGIDTFYDVDPLKRRTATTTLRNGQWVKTIRKINGLTTESYLAPATSTGSHNATDEVFVSRVTKNLVGEVVSSQQAVYLEDGATAASDAGKTNYDYDWANRKVTATKPEGGTIVTERYLDGSIYKTYGTATNGTQREVAIANSGFMTTSITRLKADGSTTLEKRESQVDWMGRTLSTSSPDDASDQNSNAQTTSYTYSSDTGQMVSMTDPDGVVILYGYDDEARRTTTATDLNGSGVIDVGDRIQLSNTAFVTTWPDSSTGYEGSYQTVSSLNGVALTTSYRTYDGLMSKSEQAGVANSSEAVTAQLVDRIDGAWTTSSINPDGTKQVATYTNYAMTSQVIKDSADVIVTSTVYGYDPDFGHRTTVTDARTGATTVNTDVATGLTISVTDPGNRETKYYYDEEGRRVTTLLPTVIGQAVNRVTSTYTAKGQVEQQWGAQTYPRSYTYDDQGRMKTLTTYRTAVDASAFPTGAGDVTTWNYYPVTGLLQSKRDADSKGADYTYTSSGRLKTRQWARVAPGTSDRLTTTYSYDFEDTSDGRQGAELVAVDYNDTTPDLGYTYTAAGQLETVKRGGLDHAAYGYDGIFRLETEELNKDTLARTLTRSYDGLGRPQSTALGNDHAVGYGYHQETGRLETVWHNPTLTDGVPSGAQAFTYGYTPSSYNLLQTVTGPVHTVTNTWELDRNVLDEKSNTLNAGGSVVSRYNYTVNAIGQRESVSQAGTTSSSIDWSYDSLGQVESAESSVVAQDRAYQYDAIGNRVTAAVGAADISSADPESVTTYSADVLNQYDTFQRGTAAPVAPSYDQDGNMLSGLVPGSGGARNSELDEALFQTATGMMWDGENRLIAMNVGSQAYSYAYDYLGRRIERVNGNSKFHFHYDGWNLLALFSEQSASTPTLSRAYTWGLDLSGSMQGAGGVGGLLVAEFKTGTYADSYFPCYDGNGNVGQYLSSSGQNVARYEYDPFGRIVSNKGARDIRHSFRFRFSTKFRDYSTGLYYYGYRWYNPVTGKWPSRDPIAERGGVNLYGFVYNNSNSWYDYLGWNPFAYFSQDEDENQIPDFTEPGETFGPIPRVGSEKCCLDGEEVEKEEDDFGRKCCPDEMDDIEYAYRPNSPSGEWGHAEVRTPNTSGGLYPDPTGGDGLWDLLDPGIVQPSQSELTDSISFRACPESVEAIEGQLEDDAENPPRYARYGCHLYACSVINGAQTWTDRLIDGPILQNTGTYPGQGYRRGWD